MMVLIYGKISWNGLVRNEFVVWMSGAGLI
jgi:hypothetical protein